MKSLPASQVKQACQQYINLKNDKEYKTCYKAFIALKQLAKNPRFEAENVCVNLQSHILTQWNLKQVISPFLKIRLEDNLNASSKSVQMILGAFGVIEDKPLIYSYLTRIEHRKGHITTKEKTETEKQTFKLLTYLLRVNLKMKTRQISRLLTIDKSTVDVWVADIEGLPESERKAIIYELVTGKQLKNDDVMDNKFRLTELHENIEESDDPTDDD